ncbi:DUF378 domain-containing protein [Candidatus Daviesbacteria bacterium]|nr:DUF378 domain-containing protein [Candidatus Daviesbacteria bacterium]
MLNHHTLAWWLVVLGAINWGLVGLLDYNLVSTLLGSGSLFERVAYALIGLAGLWLAWGKLNAKKSRR